MTKTETRRSGGELASHHRQGLTSGLDSVDDILQLPLQSADAGVQCRCRKQAFSHGFQAQAPLVKGWRDREWIVGDTSINTVYGKNNHYCNVQMRGMSPLPEDGEE